jgi:hypothetical protein
MRRAILFLLLSALPLFAGQPWPGIKFTEVRAYAWPIKAVKSVDVILPGMKLRPDVINKEGTVLTPQEVKQLLAAVTGKHRNYAVAMCHIPHNAFVFYRTRRSSRQTALVTGSSQGIDEAVAIRLAEEGANVAVNYDSHAGSALSAKSPFWYDGRLWFSDWGSRRKVSRAGRRR